MASDTDQVMELDGRGGFASELRLALDDLRRSFANSSVWIALAWHDIIAQYRGSIIGPFWITLSMGALITGMGLLYSQIFAADEPIYFAWVAAGFTLWALVSTMISDGCTMFSQSVSMIRQTNLPMFTFVWRVLARNLMVFAHHAPILIVVWVVAGLAMQINAPLALFGLLLVLVNCTWISLALALLAARFHDLPQIVTAGLQFAMFMTPVFWMTDSIHHARFVLHYNPGYYMLDAVRSPLLGRPLDTETIPVLATLAVVGWAVAFLMFVNQRRRVVHYL
jgi:ABC-type polysaccharide/polyol phosphate export permease